MNHGQSNVVWLAMRSEVIAAQIRATRVCPSVDGVSAGGSLTQLVTESHAVEGRESSKAVCQCGRVVAGEAQLFGQEALEDRV